MVHEYSHTTPAVKGILSFATFSERKHMLKTLKRKIALVAVAGLGAGLVSVAPANAANAAATSVAVTPVRVTTTANTQDSVPAATLSFVSPNALTDGGIDAMTLTVTSAPTSTASVSIMSQTDATKGFSDTLAAGPTTLGGITIATDVLSASVAIGGAVKLPIFVTSTAAGTYSGTLLLSDADANDDVTVTWSFTTTGAPTSISLDKTSASLPTVSAALATTAAVVAGNVLTVTTGAVEHGFTVGNKVTLADTTSPATYTIVAVPTAVTFTVALTAADGALADQVGTATSLVVQSDITVKLKDAAGKDTQPAVGDTITAAVADATNIVVQGAALGASYTITDSDLADGSHALRVGPLTATADSETLTFTPAGVLGSGGVVATTATVTTVAYGTPTASAATLVTAPSSSSVILKNVSAAQSDYTIDPGTSTIVVETSGLEALKAYRIGVLVSATGVGTVTIGADAAAAFTAGTVKYGYGIADATGKVVTTIALTTLLNATNTIQVNASSGDTDYTDTTDLRITATASAYAVTLTKPAVTPSVAITGAAITVEGTIADQYSSPFNGATVTVTGVPTVSSGTVTNLVKQAITDASGKFSVTLAAASAVTTALALTVTASKSGITPTQATATVNFNAGGAATAIVWASALTDEDTATTATTHPLIAVPFDDAVTSGVSDESYTLTAAAGDGTLEATDECFAVEINTTPLAQVVATGSEGVLFSTAVCAAQKVSDLKATAEVASVAVNGGANLWVTSTKTGKNTVTLTSGAVTKTITFYAQNFLTAAAKGAAARDIVLDSATKALSGGEIGFITATVTDAFGNAVEQATGVSTVKAAITGAALLDGPSLSKSGLLSDSTGKVTLGIIAGGSAGTATLTITGVNGTGGQNAALVGAATSTTTAGTNTAYKASANIKVATITVTASSSTTDTAVTAVKADVATANAAVKALATQVTVLQASVATLIDSLTTQIASLMKSVSALTKAVAKLQAKK